MAKLMVFSCPLEIGMDCLVLSEFIKRVEFPSQNLLGKYFMDKRVASPANLDSSCPHIRFIKMLYKPFVAVARLRNEMMESNELVGSTQGADLAHPRISPDVPRQLSNLYRRNILRLPLYIKLRKWGPGGAENAAISSSPFRQVPLLRSRCVNRRFLYRFITIGTCGTWIDLEQIRRRR